MPLTGSHLEDSTLVDVLFYRHLVAVNSGDEHFIGSACLLNGIADPVRLLYRMEPTRVNSPGWDVHAKMFCIASSGVGSPRAQLISWVATTLISGYCLRSIFVPRTLFLIPSCWRSAENHNISPCRPAGQRFTAWSPYLCGSCLTRQHRSGWGHRSWCQRQMWEYLLWFSAISGARARVS